MVFAPFGKEKSKESFLSAQDYKIKFSAFRQLKENQGLSWQAVERKWLLIPSHLGPEGFERLERMRRKKFSRMIIRAQEQATKARAEEIRRKEAIARLEDRTKEEQAARARPK